MKLKGLTRRLRNHPGPDAPFWVTPALCLGTLGGAALLVAGFLLMTACRGDEAARTSTGKGLGEGAQPPVSATPAANPDSPLLEAPEAPSPVPALNSYTESCLVSGAGGLAPGERTVVCTEHLLETLRAVIGYRRVPQGEVGPRLDRAELSVRHLGLDPTAEDAALLARQAALDLVELAGAVAAFVEGPGAGELAAARDAARALDPEQPLAAQSERLDAFFEAADAVVRPLVRNLSPAPA